MNTTVHCPCCRCPIALSKEEVSRLHVYPLAKSMSGKDAYAFNELLHESFVDHYEVICRRCGCTIFFVEKLRIDQVLGSL